MTEPAVQVQVDGVVMLITINRPAARNAVNLAVAEGIAEALFQLDADNALRVGVLTGAGGNFCSGMDLKAFVRGERPIVDGRGFAGLVERPPRKPLIAAVEGFAVAGGFEIVLACDLVVASTTARFGIPEVRRGLAAGGGGLLWLPRRIPYHQAMLLALTGDLVSAEQVEQWGLLARLVKPGGAVPAATELALAIAANAPLAVASSKQIVSQSVDWSVDEAFERQLAFVTPVLASEDAREGAVAFAERRPPVWVGR